MAKEFPSFDYIICGAGCAGLSLALRISSSPLLSQKTILIIDEEKKNLNDRTWCFWEKEKNYFEDIIYKSWEKAIFSDENGSIQLELQPFTYKMIRGIDFYQYSFEKLNKLPNVHFTFERVNSVYKKSKVFVETNSAIYTSELVFDSTTIKFSSDKKYFHLKQHFKGWVIETEKKQFDAGTATLMDFSIDQKNDCRFFYILPITEKKALVEYTIFNEKVFDEDDEYNRELKNYLSQTLGNNNYKIVEEEKGVIPMTNSPVNQTSFQEHIKIGMAGGLTKASSGYTFYFIQKDSDRIIKCLESGKIPAPNKIERRFNLYDSVLLNILTNKKSPAREIFSDLFRKNKCKTVLSFLNNSTTVLEDLKIMSSVKTSVFLPTAIKELMRGN